MSSRHCCSAASRSGRGPCGIGDVVDLPAETVDLEHRLALRARQHAHRRVERTAGRGGAVVCVGRRRLQRHAPAAGFDTGRRPTARRVDLAGDAADALAQQFERAEMHALAEGIAHLQHADDLVGKSLDHGDLEPEPEILHFGAERFAFIEQGFGPHRERLQALQQRRRRLRLAQHLDRCAACGQRIARQVDAVEIFVILGAVLQMVVDLQARAQRVRRGPGRGALAVDVEHEAPDRHRRIAAIMNDVVPILVTQLGDVHPERDQHVERMARRHRALGQRAAQIDRFLLRVALAQQLRFEQVEIAKLFVRAERRVVGDVVGGPDEIVERSGSAPGDADE